MEMTPIRGKSLGVRPQSISGPELHMARPTEPVRTLPVTVVTAKAPSKYTTTSLAYPLNVEGDPQQGHYITFYAKVTNPAEMKAFKAAQGRIAKVDRALKGIGGGGSGPMDRRRGNFVSQNLIDGYKDDQGLVSAAAGTSGGVKSNAIMLQSAATMRTAAAISLYMPPSLQVSYDSKYGDQEIGILAETGYQALKAFQRGTDTKDAVMDFLGSLELGAKQAILKTLDVAAPGASTLFAIDRGKIITPKMELMFEGIGRRNFSFSFVLIPKSPPEAQMIKDIVYHFKYHMAADYVKGSTREMTFPDMFDIEYMYSQGENTNLNKIATCALTKMDVEYGGDRFVAYEEGVPQTTKISLNFTEFDIITKKHIEAGF